MKWVAVGYIVPSGSRPTYTVIFSKKAEKSTAFFKVVLHQFGSLKTTILIQILWKRAYFPLSPQSFHYFSDGLTAAYGVPKSRQPNPLIPRDYGNAAAYQTDLTSGTFDNITAELTKSNPAKLTGKLHWQGMPPRVLPLCIQTRPMDVSSEAV